MTQTAKYQFDEPVSGSFTGLFSGSFTGDAGQLSVLSSSYAGTASLLLGSIQSASFAQTASFATLATTSVTASVATFALSASYIDGATTSQAKSYINLINEYNGYVVLDNFPSASREVFEALRTRIDLSGVSTVRLGAFVSRSGPAQSRLAVQYSTNETSWAFLSDGGGPWVGISTTGSLLGSEFNVVPAAKTEVVLRLVTAGGNNLSDAEIGTVNLVLGSDLIVSFTAATASLATNAISASYAGTASLLLGSIATASYAFVASQSTTALTSNNATSASFATTTLTANTATSASYALTAGAASTAVSASFASTFNGVVTNAQSASVAVAANTANTASIATSASYALTASFAANVIAPVSVSFADTSTTAITATSASYAVSASQAIFATTASAATSITFIPTTASYAVTASFAQSYIPPTSVLTASLAETSSYANSVLFQNVQNTPALVSSSTQITYSGLSGIPVGILSSSAQINLLAGVSASFASASRTSISASFAQNALSANVATSASFATSGTIAASASYVRASSIDGVVANSQNAVTASFVVTSSVALSLNKIAYTASLAPNTNWSVVFTGSTVLTEPGVYTVAMVPNDAGFTVSESVDTIYCGQMAWTPAVLSSNNSSEILLHRMGVNTSNTNVYYLRTREQFGQRGALEIRSVVPLFGTGSYYFTFTKLV